MTTTKTNRYFEGLGRRKSAIARVRVTETKKQTVLINDRDFENYFPIEELRALIQQPLIVNKETVTFSFEVHVKGGGISAQAEAIRLGIARALIVRDETMRSSLKELGLLKRNARVKERKKFGLRKARRAPQWSKR